jgi:hypothetical protein
MTVTRGFPWGRFWVTFAALGAIALAVGFILKNFF